MVREAKHLWVETTDGGFYRRLNIEDVRIILAAAQKLVGALRGHKRRIKSDGDTCHQIEIRSHFALAKIKAALRDYGVCPRLVDPNQPNVASILSLELKQLAKEMNQLEKWVNKAADHHNFELSEGEGGNSKWQSKPFPGLESLKLSVDELKNGIPNTVEEKNTDKPEIDTWTVPGSPSEWCKVFDCSLSTLKRWEKNGKLRIKKDSSKRWRIHKEDGARLGVNSFPRK